ncbi:unnamed protein product [Clonostachys rosea]|uniref:Uncharacterized protein n=1 Tax=Bionectria ochroleuca TaxID=29856 RepID=A0ABY6USQ8_BIOOC|nr:unnamed protein product [Clonostachys rosea]
MDGQGLRIVVVMRAGCMHGIQEEGQEEQNLMRSAVSWDGAAVETWQGRQSKAERAMERESCLLCAHPVEEIGRYDPGTGTSNGQQYWQPVIDWTVREVGIMDGAGVVPVRRGCHVVPIGVSTLQGKSYTLQLFQRDLARPGSHRFILLSRRSDRRALSLPREVISTLMHSISGLRTSIQPSPPFPRGSTNSHCWNPRRRVLVPPGSVLPVTHPSEFMPWIPWSGV